MPNKKISFVNKKDVIITVAKENPNFVNFIFKDTSECLTLSLIDLNKLMNRALWKMAKQEKKAS